MLDGLGGFLPYILIFLALFILPALGRRRRAQGIEKHFSRLQRQRGSRIIAMVHRSQSMGLLGIAQLRYIDLNDAEDVLHAIRTTPDDVPLELVLHTPGGLVLPALQIARAVKAHKARTTVFVPHYAMSGGTMIALAADEIVLDTHAVLGPIDPQIGGMPAASIAAVVEQKDANAVSDRTLVLADIAKKAQAQLERAAIELLTGTMSANQAVVVGQEMSSGRWTHDYPIEAQEAAAMGLPISTDMPPEFAELLALFPDTPKGSVNYARGGMALFRRRRPAEQVPVEHHAAPAERSPFVGHEPYAGARSFSYGPWNGADLRRGPSRDDYRPQ